MTYAQQRLRLACISIMFGHITLFLTKLWLLDYPESGQWELWHLCRLIQVFAEQTSYVFGSIVNNRAIVYKCQNFPKVIIIDQCNQTTH